MSTDAADPAQHGRPAAEPVRVAEPPARCAGRPAARRPGGGLALPWLSTRRWRWTSSAWGLFADLGRPAARLHRAAVLRARGVLGRLGVRDRAGRHPHRAAVPGRRAGRCAGGDAARRADRLPRGAAHRHLLRHGDPGLRPDGLLHRQPVARRSPAARTACRASPKRSSASTSSSPTRSTSTTRPLPIVLVGAGHRLAGRCTRRSAGCWSRCATTRPGPGRSGYAVDRYKVMAFVLSAFLAGLAGGVFADQPRVRLAAGAVLDHLRQGRARSPCSAASARSGAARSAPASWCCSRTGWRPAASTASASSPARSSSSSCCSSGTASGAPPATSSPGPRLLAGGGAEPHRRAHLA